MLDSLLATLDERSDDRAPLLPHDLTQTEIGRRLGLSQMHVSRLLRQAIAQLATTAQPGDSKPRPPRGPKRRLTAGHAYVDRTRSRPASNTSRDPRSLPTLNSLEGGDPRLGE